MNNASKNQKSFVPNKRQKILVARIQKLAQIIESKTLPITVEEMWVFGSMLRRKDNPHDLDIILKYSEVHPEVERLRELMESVCDLSRNYDYPSDALKHVLSTKQNAADNSVLFDWIKDYSWNLLFSGPMGIIGFVINEKSMTMRILQREIPRIHVEIHPLPSDLSNHPAKSFRLAWRKAGGFQSSEIKKMFADPELLSTLKNDSLNFDNVIFRKKLELDILSKIVERFFTDKITETSLDAYLSNITAQHANQNVIRQTIRNIRYAHPEDLDICSPSLNNYDNFTLSGLQSVAEKKRLIIKDIEQEIIVLRQIIVESFYARTDGEISEYNKQFNINQIVARNVLNDIRKYQVNENKIRSILAKFNLPEQDVLSEKIGRLHYIIPENEERKNEIIHTNRRIDLQTKYKKDLYPLIKKLNPNLNFYISVEKNSQVFATLYFRYDEDDNSLITKQTVNWCLAKNFRASDYDRFTLRLEIPLTHAKDVQEMKQIIKNILLDSKLQKC